MEDFFEAQINTNMEDVELLNFEQFDVAIYTQKKPIPQHGNEDALGIFVSKEGSLVAAVADGMGGHRGADQASRIAIETLQTHLEDFKGSELSLRAGLLDAIQLAQQKIFSLGIGAGTTLSLVSWTPEGVRFFNLGDSAAIHLDSLGNIRYRSFEHSVGGMQFVTGMIEEREVGQRDDHHQLINFLGSDQMKIEMSGLRPWSEGDSLLLGSDGLFDNIVASEIYNILTSEDSADARLTILVEMAKDNMKHGGLRRPKPDDLTAILIS